MNHEEDQRVDEALALRECDGMGDWYTIERADHDGRAWFQPTEYGASLMMSCRITDACVEGTAWEMLAIAKAIRERGTAGGTRCDVEFDGVDFRFCSPRNSLYSAIVSTEIADSLADEIEAKLASKAAQ